VKTINGKVSFKPRVWKWR